MINFAFMKVFSILVPLFCLTQAYEMIQKDFDIEKASGLWFIYNEDIPHTCPVIEISQGSSSSNIIIESRRYRLRGTNSTDCALQLMSTVDLVVKDGQLYSQNLDNDEKTIYGVVQATDYETYLILKRHDTDKRTVMIRKPELEIKEEQMVINILKQIEENYQEEVLKKYKRADYKDFVDCSFFKVAAANMLDDPSPVDSGAAAANVVTTPAAAKSPETLIQCSNTFLKYSSVLFLLLI